MTMSTNKNKKIYMAKNKDGYLCGFDADTHKCIDVPLCTGCDVDYIKQHEKEWLGQLDPKYKK